MKYSFFIILILLLLASKSLNAQVETVPLWKGTIPNSIDNPNYEEIKTYEDSILTKVKQVKTPSLTIYYPKKPNGTSIVICPGGGYQHLSINKEGYKVAEWLNTLGITAFVLKYRLPSDRIMENKTMAPLQDAQEALRFVRRHAEIWNLNEDKIGIMGFSAGGHLAATLSTHYKDEIYRHDEVSARPDFSILVYPVISMNDKIAHKGSKANLLGSLPSKELIEKYSNEKQVDSLTPLTFLVHAVDDKSVPEQNSIDYFLALKKHNVPVEIHLYQNGGHGFGLGKNGTSQYWVQQCEEWIKLNHFLN